MKKIIFNISLIALLIVLAVLFGFIPTKSQVLIFPKSEKRVFTYGSFIEAVAEHLPVGSKEHDIISFWENQNFKTRYTKIDMTGIPAPQNAKYSLVYDFEKLFSSNCVLSKGDGGSGRLGYYFDAEGKVLSATLITGCGVYPYR